MRVLVIAGVGAFALVMPLTLVIVVVLAIVATSYRQTIKAYPHGASSYIVASDNLGAPAGLVAAGALLIDYTLTVAVSVSAGVAAITSMVPALYAEKVLIAVVIVVALTLGNLRGVRESGTIFMAPTYLYIVAVLGVIAFGLIGLAAGIIPPYTPPPEWLAEEASGAAGALGLLLILRAFSSGAVALTGVEAVSDGVPAFKPPEWRNARTTLTWAAGLFAVLFVGISLLVSILGIIPDPSEQQTVLYVLTRHIAGDGPYLVFVQVATALILTLAANTSFADFPRLSSFLARDGYMPRQFGFRGDRLAFSTGIIALAGLAIVLLIGFEASVSALIPALHAGRVRRLHPLAERHGAAMVASPRAGLAPRTGHQWPGRRHDRRDRSGGGRQQVHVRRLAGDDPGSDAGCPDVGDPRPLPAPRTGGRASFHGASQRAGPLAPGHRADRAAGPALAGRGRVRPLHRSGRAGGAHHQ